MAADASSTTPVNPYPVPPLPIPVAEAGTPRRPLPSERSSASSGSRRTLHQPSGQYEPTYYTVVQRYQLQYSPKSGTEINHDRLPTVDALAGMDLAFREQQYSDAAIQDFSQGTMLAILKGTLIAAISLVIVGNVVPLYSALGAAGGVTSVASLVLAYRRRVSVGRLVKVFLFPLVAVLAAAGFAIFSSHRLYTTLGVGAISIGLFWWWGGELFTFYRDYLYTHPRLKPSTRKWPEHLTLTPDLKVLAGIIAIAAFVPLLSPTLAMVVLVAWTVYLIRKAGPIRTVLQFIRLPLAQFMTYGVATTGAPGVWMPETTYGQRRFHVVLLTGTVYLTLAVGLSVFFPWDLVTPTLFRSQFREEPSELNKEAYSEFKSELKDEAHGWLQVVAWSSFSNPAYVWCYPVAIGFALTIPNLVLLAIYRKPIMEAERLRQKIEGYGPWSFGSTTLPPDAIDNDGRSEWQWYIDRLRDSRHSAPEPLGGTVYEADHLFLGVEPNAQFPILLHRSILSEHAYIAGQSGSGKTSLALMPLLIQLIRGAGPNSGRATDSPPIVILDLKGDPALFFTLKAEAEARRVALRIDDSTEEGRRDPRCAFRFFTPEANRASHYFNPFASLQTQNRSVIQTCQLLLESLGLNHGEGYGRSYYSRRSRQLLFKALNHRSSPQSFDQLYELLNSDEFSGAEQETLELLSTIEAMTQYPMLALNRNLTRPEQAIHMPSVIEHRQVVYFWLPSAVESVSVREIAKLALYSYLTAAIDRQREGKPYTQGYLVIDEFQRIASEGFRIILEQARSFGIGAILANQTPSDLRTADMDLRPAIYTNTRYKQFFSVSEPNELNDLSTLSGLELALAKGWNSSSTSSSQGGSSSSGSSSSEGMKPRLTINDLLRISDHPLDSVLHISRGAGYTQFGGFPIPMRSTWAITNELYKERQKEKWPEKVDAYDEAGLITSNRGPAEVEAEHDERMATLASESINKLAARKASEGG